MRGLNLAFRFACEPSFVAVGQTAIAIVFAVLAVVTAALVRVWPEPVA